MIYTWVQCTYSSYSHIHRLVVELNSYDITVLITERSFAKNVCCVPYISSLTRYSIWNTGTSVIKLYMFSTHVYLGLSLLIWRMWHIELAHMVIILVRYSNPVCVPVHAYVISCANVCHRYCWIHDLCAVIHTGLQRQKSVLILLLVVF